MATRKTTAEVIPIRGAGFVFSRPFSRPLASEAAEDQEITSSMIDAGISALIEFEHACQSRSLVCAVYLAMLRQRKEDES